MPSQLLEMRGITKVFPGVTALSGVDFTLRAGEIHALMGENGAGKSTLIKVLTGVHPAEGGAIRLAGEPVSPRSPQHAQSLGISTVYQEVNLVPGLSVAENVMLGRQPRRLGGIDWRATNRAAASAMRRLDLDIDVTRPVSAYSIAVQQMVAIARALDVEARALVLDEPTSSLDTPEVQRLFALMRRLRDQGLGIVFVTHFLGQVYEVTDRITVLRNGRLVGEYETAKLSRLDLIGAMLGRDPAEVEARPAARVSASAAPGDGEPARRPVLSARGLGKRGTLEPIDLDLAAGETVGLAGLLGSGRTETARLLFGADRPDRGAVAIDGRAVSIKDCGHAIALGLGLSPEDRKAHALIPDLSVRENLVLVLQARRGWLRRLSARKQAELADRFIREMNIATPDAERPIRFLSGGNQQKVILARWLACKPRVLMLDEPTRGIDVGAKFEISRLVEDLAREGMAVLFISSELEEVVRTSTRVAVMRDRRKVGELTGEGISEAAVMATIARKAEGHAVDEHAAP